MTERNRKAAALDAAITGMFGTLAARGVPEHLQNVVDQLDAAAMAEDALARPGDDPMPSPSPSSSPEP